MDESLQELENELKRLPPRGLSPGLLAALERELGPVPATARVRAEPAALDLRAGTWVRWLLAGAAVAATVALALVLRPDRVPASAPMDVAVSGDPAVAVAPAEVAANRYEPVRASSVLYDLQESAPTTLPDRTEGREVRYRYVDTFTWKNPTTNASVRWSVPRDEVRLVRANLD